MYTFEPILAIPHHYGKSSHIISHYTSEYVILARNDPLVHNTSLSITISISLRINLILELSCATMVTGSNSTEALFTTWCTTTDLVGVTLVITLASVGLVVDLGVMHLTGEIVGSSDWSVDVVDAVFGMGWFWCGGC